MAIERCELAKMEREAAAKTAEVSRLGDSAVIKLARFFNPYKKGFCSVDKKSHVTQDLISEISIRILKILPLDKNIIIQCHNLFYQCWHTG